MFSKQILKRIILRFRMLPKPTLRGIILLFAGFLGLYAGFKFGDILVLQFALFIFIILIVSFIIAENNLRDLVFNRDMPLSSFAGHPINVRINIKNQRNMSNSYCLELEDQLLGNGCFNRMNAQSAIISQNPDKLLLDEVGTDNESHHFADTVIRRRGIYRYFWYRCNSYFPFGLFRKDIRGMLRTDITVYPNPLVPLVLKEFCGTGAGDKEGFSRFARDNQGAFKGMGEYALGDPVNLIHWPLSARYQKVVIKEFDNACQDDFIVVFHSYAPKGIYRRQSKERALGLLSGIFMQLYNSRHNFRFVADFNNWEPIQVNEDIAGLEKALLSLSMAKLTSHKELTLLQGAVDSYLYEDNRVIVMSNTPKKHWMKKLPSHPALLCLDNKVKFEKIF